MVERLAPETLASRSADSRHSPSRHADSVRSNTAPGLSEMLRAIGFDGNGAGKVTFCDKRHTGPGMHCPDCHFELFDVSRSLPITRADHRVRQTCFVCHGGQRAFASRRNCDRCHVEPEVESVADVTLQAALGPLSGPTPSPSGDKP